jgi:hypothetical protein
LWAIERSQNPVLYFDFRVTDGLLLKMALVDGRLFLCRKELNVMIIYVDCK